jgi:hypothetical protein
MPVVANPVKLPPIVKGTVDADVGAVKLLPNVKVAVVADDAFKVSHDILYDCIFKLLVAVPTHVLAGSVAQTGDVNVPVDDRY